MKNHEISMKGIILKEVLHALVPLIGFYIIFFTNVRKLGRGGFYCDDPKLMFKYQKSLISGGMLFGMALLLPIPIFFFGELVTGYFKICKIANPMLSFGKLYWKYLYFFAMQFVTSEILKIVVGEPRPYFFDVCKPNVGLNCTGYIDDYKCEDEMSIVVDNAYKSFPSGHTIFITSEALILIYYLQKRLGQSKLKSIVLLLQLLLYTGALINAVSRIQDHHHHWWDVVGGAVFSIIASYLGLRHIFNKFEVLQYQSMCMNEN